MLTPTVTTAWGSSAQVPVLLTRELSESGYEEEEERVVGNHAGKRSPFTV